MQRLIANPETAAVLVSMVEGMLREEGNSELADEAELRTLLADPVVAKACELLVHPVLPVTADAPAARLAAQVVRYVPLHSALHGSPS